jgi:hypothetical protein
MYYYGLEHFARNLSWWSVTLDCSLYVTNLWQEQQKYSESLILFFTHFPLQFLFLVLCSVEHFKSQKSMMDGKSLQNNVLKEDVHFSGAVYPWSSQAGYSSIHHHSTNKNCTRGLQHVMWWHGQIDPQTSAYNHLKLALPITLSI